MLQDIEKNSVIVAGYDAFIAQLVPPSISEPLEYIGREIALFFNPEVATVKSCTDVYLMSSFTSAVFTTIFYLVSVYLLRVIVKAIAPNPVVPKPGGYKNLSEKFAAEPVLIFGAFYNIIQVVACAYMVYASLAAYIQDNMTVYCNKHDLTSETIARIHWLFYMSKILDFVDTYMIVLRRKWRQLSFLHLYHHASVFFLQWLFQRVAHDGDMWFVIFANTFVHTIMYFYYFLRTIDVTVPLVFKRMITNVQLFQFSLMLIQAGINTYYECAYPHRMTFLYFWYIVSMFTLFTNFFIANYTKKSKKKKEE